MLVGGRPFNGQSIKPKHTRKLLPICIIIEKKKKKKKAEREGIIIQWATTQSERAVQFDVPHAQNWPSEYAQLNNSQRTSFYAFSQDVSHRNK